MVPVQQPPTAPESESDVGQMLRNLVDLHSNYSGVKRCGECTNFPYVSPHMVNMSSVSVPVVSALFSSGIFLGENTPVSTQCVRQTET